MRYAVVRLILSLARGWKASMRDANQRTTERTRVIAVIEKKPQRPLPKPRAKEDKERGGNGNLYARQILLLSGDNDSVHCSIRRRSFKSRAAIRI